MIRQHSFLLLILVFNILSYTNAAAMPCTYSTWEWNTHSRRSENHRIVKTEKSKLTKEEKGRVEGCTVCDEDQRDVKISSLPPIKICHIYAEKAQTVLNVISKAGFPLRSLIGYRVGRSKGPIDSKGFRSEFSNHSFGLALDINAEINGLYNHCEKFGPHCRLIRGGKYDPNVSGSVTPTSTPYQEFKKMGWKWGGELVGQQKDFMHFSLTGD